MKNHTVGEFKTQTSSLEGRGNRVELTEICKFVNCSTRLNPDGYIKQLVDSDIYGHETEFTTTRFGCCLVRKSLVTGF